MHKSVHPSMHGWVGGGGQKSEHQICVKTLDFLFPAGVNCVQLQLTNNGDGSISSSLSPKECMVTNYFICEISTSKSSYSYFLVIYRYPNDDLPRIP